jgi:hypothetical protein
MSGEFLLSTRIREYFSCISLQRSSARERVAAIEGIIKKAYTEAVEHDLYFRSKGSCTGIIIHMSEKKLWLSGS